MVASISMEEHLRRHTHFRSSSQEPPPPRVDETKNALIFMFEMVWILHKLLMI